MEAKVARILSDTEIVLNVGSEHSVKCGEQFLIYEMGEEIFDPETKEALGRLEIQKGVVEIINVQPKMSIARTGKRTYQKTQVVDPIKSFRRAANFFESYSELVDVTVQDRLKVESTDSDYSERLFVRVGNLARRIEK